MLDRLIGEFDRSLRALTGVVRATRSVPQGLEEAAAAELSAAERKQAGALMRVNHTGEICAQALYQAQKLTTQSARLKGHFERAAREEEDHLSWLAERLDALDARPSLLNPLWYAGAFAIGLIAGKMGDRISLGFMAETERQVEQHLERHLEKLPLHDYASRAVVEQMRVDEIAHGQAATEAGGQELPLSVRRLMRMSSRVMTSTAYYI
ncbi:2-polyprenyl-3-methyl-6-methoxy-1,4-benzoquinone monooxygenase [Mycoavidus sp. B2-EB]|uniref:2-polyprenyl-3-methyl-6-methoxy-1,4-benzoquinone monooxygenase n=1 Tax=Mycoavidus sp. B2-EB TaxID=2651972 RepID=UPI00162494C6|nr:2-polyprenyl-3-methyl-6-methoxy-1,4-benzoquinone monooxygenase [Mycoavidus sp. B2-EB]